MNVIAASPAGVNAANVAGAPSESESVAGTAPPVTARSHEEQLVVAGQEDTRKQRFSLENRAFAR